MIAPFLLSAIIAAAPAATEFAATYPYVQAVPSAHLVVLQVVVAAGTARETRAQSGLAALSAETILHTEIDGTPLANRVAAAGGSISYAVAPDVVRFTVETLPAAAPAIVRDLSTAFISPDVSPSAIAAARTMLGHRIDQGEADPIDVGLEMLSSSYYKGGAALPPYGTRANISALGPADVSAFIATHYVRGNIFVTAVGDVDQSSTRAAAAALDQLPPGSEPAVPIASDAPGARGKSIVTKRDIGVPVALLGFAAPAIGDTDFATMLVLSAMLQNVGQRDAVALLSGAGPSLSVVYRYDVKPAMLTVVLNGGLVNPSAAISAVGVTAQRAAAQPLSTAALDRFRAQARGQWLLQTATLADRSWLLGTAIATSSNTSSDTVAAAIDRVTASDVQRVAAAFLLHFTEAVVLPRAATPAAGD
jgi:predicted Zn-dependent peptidase